MAYSLIDTTVCTKKFRNKFTNICYIVSVNYQDMSKNQVMAIEKYTGDKKKPRSKTGSNYIVRCSLKELNRLIKHDLNDLQKVELVKIGWGFLLEYKLDSNISRP